MGIFIQDIEPTIYVGNESNISGYCEEYMVYPSGFVPYPRRYLTFRALESGTTFSFTNDIDYSVDDGNNWVTLSANTASPAIESGDTIIWRETLTPTSGSGIGTFSSTGRFNAEGNIMSLLYGDNFVGQTSLSEKSHAFENLYSGCTGLTYSNNLILPATTLVQYCYSNMFNGCSSLIATPVLPASTLGRGCYYRMFEDCTSLVNAPQLPATTLAQYCYDGMFKGCSSLINAPVLSAITLAQECYRYMFSNCTSLTSAPALPANTLSLECYYGMFFGCSGLTIAPVLSATTLAESCYSQMFYNCINLTTAPDLPATTLAVSCYDNMFAGCTSLTTAHELPADTLTDSCYREMFYRCSGLTSAPILSATTLADNCYRGMFSRCSNLNYIKMLATDISATDCLTNWVDGVAATGTFVKSASQTSLPTGVNGIPSGWTVEDDRHNYSNDYFTFRALQNSTFKFTKATQYSIDSGQTWTALNANTNSPTIASGDTILWKAQLTPDISNGIGRFSSSGRYEIEGNPMSMLFGDNFTGQTSLSGKNYAFFNMFSGSTQLVSAENIAFPATTLAPFCYCSMFILCSNLTTPPQLPAVVLEESCYRSMFNSCSSLTTAPELPAPMLVNSCYKNMFDKCRNLNYVKMLATNISATDCLNNWLGNVSSSGTFVKAASQTSLPTGKNGIPSGWTVIDE